jgi:hypothetical protein
MGKGSSFCVCGETCGKKRSESGVGLKNQK